MPGLAERQAFSSGTVSACSFSSPNRSISVKRMSIRSVPGIDRMRPRNVALRPSEASPDLHSSILLEGSLNEAAAWPGITRASASTANVTRRRGIVMLQRCCARRVALSSPWAGAGRAQECELAPLGCAATEPLDAAAGVYELLAARVERVAVGADLDVQLGLRRASRELVAAGT